MIRSILQYIVNFFKDIFMENPRYPRLPPGLTYSADCSVNYCRNTHDRRCGGGLCSIHCNTYCDGVCQQVWAHKQTNGVIGTSYPQHTVAEPAPTPPQTEEEDEEDEGEDPIPN